MGPCAAGDKAKEDMEKDKKKAEELTAAAKKAAKDAEDTAAANKKAEEAKKKEADKKKDEEKKGDEKKKEEEKKKADDKSADMTKSVDELVEKIVKDATEGVNTPNSKLADLLSDTLLKHTKGAASKDVEKLESAVGLVVVEA